MKVDFQAKKISLTRELHGEKIVDNYAWLRDKDWPRVTDPNIINYLEKENSYFEKVLQDDKPFTDELFAELKGRIQQNDITPPYKDGGFIYYSYINEGKDYWVHARKKLDPVSGKDAENAIEEVLLDINVLSESHEFTNVADKQINHDHTLLAYSVDHKGDERYQIFVKNLPDSKITLEVTGALGNIVWCKDGFFYIQADENWIRNKVFYHTIGQPQSEDILIFHEIDPTFHLDISESNSKSFLFITSTSANSTEVQYIYILKADVTFELKIIQPRTLNYKYQVQHHSDYFYILTNDSGNNFRLIKVPIASPDIKNSEEIYPHSELIYLKSLYIYKDHLVVLYKLKGLPQIKFVNLRTKIEFEVKFDHEAYDASILFTTFDSPALRYVYSSLNTPNTIKEINFETYETKILKVQEIPSGLNPDDYTVKRIYAPSKDRKVVIPISLIYKTSLFSTKNPMLLYGYGSYGYAVPAGFRSSIFSILDRGFVYAIAHIRGGDDISFDWYESAKLLNKKRTFEDFISSTEYLISQGYSTKGNITIHGGSAGGMLVGAVMNMKPELFKSVIAQVPFVDVLNTMLDETLPLTQPEFKEWGNPKQKDFYDYIKSYSPYDNIESKAYPNIFVTGGLTDPRVGYWEPAKWVAKLRELKTDDNLILFKTEMSAGHGGASGRFKVIEEIALLYTCILKFHDKI